MPTNENEQLDLKNWLESTKHLNVQAWLANINHVVDGLGLPLDEQIKRPVAIFNWCGFPTTASCYGHSDWGCNYPWVEINDKVVQPTLQQLMEKYGANNLLIEEFPKHFYVRGIGRSLITEQKEMIDFCEWLMSNYERKINE